MYNHNILIKLTGQFYSNDVICNLSTPGFTPSPPTMVNKTATTIIVHWTPVPLMICNKECKKYTISTSGSKQNT